MLQKVTGYIDNLTENDADDVLHKLDCIEELGNLNSLHYVVEVMRYFQDSRPDILYKCISVLHHYAIKPMIEGHSCLVTTEDLFFSQAIAQVYLTRHTYPEDLEMTIIAMEFFKAVAMSASTTLRKSLAHGGLVEVILISMALYPQHEQIISCGLTAIGYLCAPTSEPVVSSGSGSTTSTSGDDQRQSEEPSNINSQTPYDLDETQQVAVEIGQRLDMIEDRLNAIAAQVKEVKSKSLAYTAGVKGCVHRTLQLWAQPCFLRSLDVALGGCYALWALTIEVENANMVVAKKGIETMIASWKRFGQHKPLSSLCCRIVCNIARVSEEYCLYLYQAKALKQIIKSVHIHPYEEIVLRSALGALTALALEPMCRKVVLVYWKELANSFEHYVLLAAKLYPEALVLEPENEGFTQPDDLEDGEEQDRNPVTDSLIYSSSLRDTTERSAPSELWMTDESTTLVEPVEIPISAASLITLLSFTGLGLAVTCVTSDDSANVLVTYRLPDFNPQSGGGLKAGSNTVDLLIKLMKLFPYQRQLMIHCVTILMNLAVNRSNATYLCTVCTERLLILLGVYEDDGLALAKILRLFGELSANNYSVLQKIFKTAKDDPSRGNNQPNGKSENQSNGPGTGVGFILRIMKKFTSSSQLMSSACRFIRAMAVDNETRHALIASDAVEIIVTSLRQFSSDSQLVTDASGALWSLSRVQPGKDQIMTLDGMPLLMQIGESWGVLRLSEGTSSPPGSPSKALLASLSRANSPIKPDLRALAYTVRGALRSLIVDDGYEVQLSQQYNHCADDLATN